jgi:group II intron reverse transcriptase/maturase
MRNAETILAVIQERGKRGLPLERVYRLLFNRNLYLAAYGKIYRNDGATTPGSTRETVDGMSQAKIEAIIEALRLERYRWTPVRRTYIPKTDGKQRPLGIPTWSDKLLQEAIRMILEAYFEPQFSDHSHGFRADRGCHTALREIKETWLGTVWFIEGDISGCFDNIDHEVLLSILAERIHDGRFLRLIANLLKAGYLEEWKFNVTLSGTPQGGIVSPILANIYLDRLDKYVETTLLPAHNRGTRRKPHPEYHRMGNRMRYLANTGRATEAKALRRKVQSMPSVATVDPGYRRLRYARYADDFLLGFTGPRAEAEAIKRQLQAFLRDMLKLELSETKTLITHARTKSARFLGYEVVVLQANQQRDVRGKRTINGQIGLKVPVDVVKAKCRAYMRHGKPIHRRERTHDTAFSIVEQYQTEYRGLVQYYQMAFNLHRLDRLRWVMEQSLTKTLAAKWRITVQKVFDRLQTTIGTPDGSHKVLQVVIERGEGKKPLVAQWGAISLKHRTDAVLNDQPLKVRNRRTELLERLLADGCELCGSRIDVQVHHIRRLSDLRRKGRAEKPEWVKQMAARHRKTLVVCHRCHTDIHAGRLTGTTRKQDTGEPDEAKVSRPVRRGADGKVPT